MAQGKGSEDLLKSILNEAKILPIRGSAHLEPEDSPLSAPVMVGIWLYKLMVAKRLLEPADVQSRSIAEGRGNQEVASVVCLPSFGREWLLWTVGQRKAGYSIILIEAEQSIWHSYREENVSLSESVNSSKRELATEIALPVCAAWEKVLSQTRYDSKEREFIVRDGVAYHFGYWGVGTKPMAGKTRSPDQSTVPGKLVSLGHALRDYAKTGSSPNRQVEETIAEHLDWFQTHFRQAEVEPSRAEGPTSE